MENCPQLGPSSMGMFIFLISIVVIFEHSEYVCVGLYLNGFEDLMPNSRVVVVGLLQEGAHTSKHTRCLKC